MSSLKTREVSEQKHFDAMARNYDNNYHYSNDFFTYKKNKKLMPLFKLLETSHEDVSLLELGCGTGEYTASLAARFSKLDITGIDISGGILREAAKKCRKYPRVKFIRASAYSLPFPQKHFDVVCGFYIAHHLDLEKMFSEIGRVIKPGGTVYLVEPNLLNPIVFLIKNVPYLKKRAGDSPEESAINPLNISDFLPARLQLKSVSYSEFIPPAGFISDNRLISLDRITSGLSHIPGLQLLSGSLIIRIEAGK